MTIIVSAPSGDWSYAFLCEQVARWLHRSDLTDDIPNFVRMAEAQIYRRLNVFPREIEVDLVSEVGSRFVALPPDYAEPLGLWSSHVEPRYEFTATIASALPINDDDARLPIYWAIDGANIAFEVPTDQAYPLQFRYFQTTYLSNAVQTNPLFLRAPEMFLYGALSHAAPFLADDARTPMWEAKFKQLMLEVAAEASRSKSVATLQTEIPASLICSANSRRGWRY